MKRTDKNKNTQVIGLLRIISERCLTLSDIYTNTSQTDTRFLSVSIGQKCCKKLKDIRDN